MNPSQIENIENRLMGASKWPWHFSPKDNVIEVARNRDINKVFDASCVNPDAEIDHLKFSNEDTIKRLLHVVEASLGTDKDTMKFIASAPTDIEALLATVRQQQELIGRLEAKAEDLSGRLATSAVLTKETESELRRIKSVMSSFKREVEAI